MSAVGEINRLKEAYDCNLASFKEYYVLTKLFLKTIVIYKNLQK